MGKLDGLERVTVKTRAELRGWLAANHSRQEGIWLVTYKKGAGKLHLPYEEVVEEALCFGWIDGQTRSLDGRRTMLLLTPRRPKSVWSRPNKERVERLIANRLMRPEGLAKIERAKKDGSWDFLNDVDAQVIPEDLAAAFAGSAQAREVFDALTVSVRRQLLYDLKCAKGASTREVRIARILARCGA
jgi:uncharacterized protein YdeI (YjbR/CyaY-like superfamily)